jgi:hypothetical protein
MVVIRGLVGEQWSRLYTKPGRAAVQGSNVFVCLLLLVPVASLVEGATVYRCAGDDGEPRYQQHACSGEGAEVEIPPPALRWDALRPAERSLVESYRQAERVEYPPAPARRQVSERTCWNKRRSLDRVSTRLRRGYKASEAQRLHDRQDELSEYLRRYCE